jgi:hypothetical protein
MENNTKIGIGVLVLAGVGYYFYNKNKSPMPNVSSTTVNEPKKAGFDREKASKELAKIFFALYQKNNVGQPVKQPQTQVFVTDVKTGLQRAVSVVEPIRKNPITELSLYKKILGGLNGILDDSDAEFVVNYFKKFAQAGDDRNFKPDLDTQIRIDAIQIKYPDALKQLDLG